MLTFLHDFLHLLRTLLVGGISFMDKFIPIFNDVFQAFEEGLLVVLAIPNSL